MYPDFTLFLFPQRQPKMARPRSSTPCFIIYVYFLLTFQAASSADKFKSSNLDFKPLLDFKSSADKFNNLPSWNSSTDLCTWSGISCTNKRVTRLVLEDLQLSGSLEPLASLTQLRLLSLKRNDLSGPLPDLSNLKALKLLFLSHNKFSGAFPASVASLTRLYRIDFSFNNFSGQIPSNVNHLTHLLTLRLEENQFAGEIPSINLLHLQDFNVSGNLLSGEIPDSLSGFPESAFRRNLVLCGSPFPKCKSDASSNPTKPGSAGASPSPVSNSPTVPSTPSAAHVNSSPEKSQTTHHSNTARISTLALILIILGDAMILALVSLILYCYFWRNYASKLRDRKGSKVLEGEKIVYSSPYPNTQPQAQAGFNRGKMVFFEGTRKFELEDLLRASAEMLGKGGFGTAYKAVLDDGHVVAVKRLKDASVCGKKEFEQHMEVLGRLRHPNLVSLKAYYFAREEKLLVYEYMPNGSLFWLLHGNRGPGRTPLDWTTRLKIAAGAARGLAFIHTSCKSLKLVHGNIKSTNVLVDKDGTARISDFGLTTFAQSSVPLRSNGYRAPEQADGQKQTQRSDIFSFGVLLLELLTGKCPLVLDSGGGPGSGSGGPPDLPRWVQSVVREEWTAEVFDLELMRYKDIEEEMVGMLQIAMACTAAVPDQRPRISHVLNMISEIRGLEVLPCRDGIDSVAESPCLSEETGGTLSQ